MLAIVIFSGFLVLVTVTLAAAVGARHRAEAAADLAALAAAGEPSSAAGCAHARRVAAANEGRLDGCRRMADGSVVVDVELRGGADLLPGTVRASARAGVGSARSDPVTGAE